MITKGFSLTLIILLVIIFGCTEFNGFEGSQTGVAFNSLDEKLIILKRAGNWKFTTSFNDEHLISIPETSGTATYCSYIFGSLSGSYDAQTGVAQFTFTQPNGCNQAIAITFKQQENESSYAINYRSNLTGSCQLTGSFLGVDTDVSAYPYTNSCTIGTPASLVGLWSTESSIQTSISQYLRLKANGTAGWCINGVKTVGTFSAATQTATFQKNLTTTCKFNYTFKFYRVFGSLYYKTTVSQVGTGACSIPTTTQGIIYGGFNDSYCP